jgi:hypothetical protein
MNTAYHLVGVTNRIAITALNQYDTNMANNTNQAAVLTRVLLTRFEASAAGGTVVLEWETASEEATAGFYLLRLTEAGDWVKVGGGLLPSLPDSPQGGVYRLLDGGADPAAALTYELVEIEAGGVERSCGRFIVRPSGPAPSRSGARTAAALQEAGGYTAEPRIQAPAAARASAAAETPVCPAPAAAASRAKLRVRETALYFVDGASVAAALGLTAEEAAARIQAGGLALRIRTDAVAYLPASGGSGFYFWGTAPESLSAPENVYWMEEGPGLLMATAEGDGPLPGPRATFAETLHVEQNRYALTGLFTDPEADYWTWDSLVAGNPTAGSKRFALHVPGVAAVEHVATLVVHLQGVTATGRKDEHHVQVRLNGRLVGDGRWTGAAATAFPFAIDQRGFVSGDNTVELTAVLDAGVPHSVFHLQAFDLSYRRRCEAEQDRVRLRTDGPAVVSVSGFGTPAIRVFDLSDPLRPVHVAAITVDEAMDSYRVSFVSAGTGVPYAAVGSAAVQSPLGIAADAPSALREPGAADYVIIAPPALAAAAGALADHRAAGGYRARVVDLEDIYDEFSGGLAEPAAIREFLAWAAGHWSVPPRYVVLAGDGTFDYRGHKGYADNLLPAIMVGTPQGLFAWDGAYADVDRDGLADMAVGRLPADTPSQLQALVAGIVSYESRAPSDWPARVLLAADNDDGGGSFRAAGEAVRGRLPPKWDTRRAYLDEWRIEECRNGLFAALAEGVQFFAYFGHAGIDRLAAEGLLLGAESAALDNGGWPPILTAMTCVMGQFSVPGFDCLGETLLLAPRGGVAAVWAPSGMSLNEPAAALCAEVYTAVFERGQAVLGDAIRAALAAYAEGAQARYLGRIYNLLGAAGRGHAPLDRIRGLAARAIRRGAACRSRRFRGRRGSRQGWRPEPAGIRVRAFTLDPERPSGAASQRGRRRGRTL